MKTLFIAMGLVATALMGYLYGSLEPRVLHEPMMGYKQTACSDIAHNQAGNLVCEVNLKAEDDDFIIFRKGY